MELSTIDNFVNILINSQGLCVIHINPSYYGYYKKIISKRMGIKHIDYKKWLNEVRDLYTCPLVIEFKFKLFD